jgi:sec-independent protein translocase protein TatC
VQRKYDEDLFESTKMTFGEHLEELRRALIFSVIALVIGSAVGFWLSYDVVDYVQTPLRKALTEHYGRMAAAEYRTYLDQRRKQGLPVPEDVDAAVKLYIEEGLVAEERYVDPQQALEALRGKLPDLFRPAAEASLPDANQAVRRDALVKLRFYHDLNRDSRVRLIGTGSQDVFVAYMKVALVLGALLSSPFIFYFIWEFVAAGLYPHEKKYVHIFLPFSLGLFLAGAALAFFVVFKYVLGFLLWFYEIMNIDPELRITDWLSFVLILPLGFGIAFQMPLVMLFLERIGILSTKIYMANWRISVLVICFISMVLTPAEPYSMVFMAVPLVLLYFFGIWLCKVMPRRTTPFGESID